MTLATTGARVYGLDIRHPVTKPVVADGGTGRAPPRSPPVSTESQTTTPAVTPGADPVPAVATDPAGGTAALEQVTENLLVEDVSIDGMCGVY